MNRSKEPTPKVAHLRRLAEGRLDDKQRKLRTKELEIFGATERLVHELEVHQVELDMQNEELRRSTASLETSLAEYAELYDFAPVGYFTLDRGGAIQRLNLTGARLLGVERAHLIHRRLETFVSPTDRDTFRNFLEHVFGTPGHGSCDLAILPWPKGAAPEGPAGDPIYVRLAASVASNNKECRALAMDVTEQTRADRALRESELLFRTLVEAMQDSVITTDRQGHVTRVRSKRLEGLGIDTAAFIGKAVSEVYGTEVGATHEAVHTRVLSGESVVYEWTHEIGGQRFQMQTIASPLRDAEGRITGSLDVSRDLTNMKRLHERVLLSERMGALGILAAGIAHEINNPLAVVIANLDAMLEDLRRVERGTAAARPYLGEALESLGDCLESAERVRQIVRDLKLFSRPDETSNKLVDLQHVVKTSLKLVNNEIRHRAKVVTEFGDVPRVLGNEARFGQVFLNLLVNAAQSLPEGYADRHTIAVRTLRHGSGCALVEISDDGPGIPPEVMAHIFEPFFTTKPIGVGTGLGLAISRQIVTGFGGEITADSEVGKGARFRVLLPAATDEVTEVAEQPLTESPVTGRRGRILLIDDDPDVLKMTARTLSTHHEVVAVLRAQEALDRISAGETFDLVVSDLMMPEMTGVDLHGALMNVAPQHAKQMIFLTGGAFTARARSFLRSVDNLRFDKPFDRQNLLALVDRMVT